MRFLLPNALPAAWTHTLMEKLDYRGYAMHFIDNKPILIWGTLYIFSGAKIL